MVRRKLVTKDELATILTERLHQVTGNGCLVQAAHIIRLKFPHPDGRNWLPRVDGGHCWSALFRVFATAQHEFNLAE
jgi:hypothetical protein